MKKRKLKPFVKISLVIVILMVSVIGVTTLLNNKTIKVGKEKDNFTYVNDYIFDNYYPVVNSDELIAKPFNSDQVSLYKGFYDKDATEEEQQNAIIYHEGIYMQNSGVDYKSDDSFDILASISGTVTNISDDTLFGKSIEVRNSNEILDLYQCLSEISVKKGDSISQGQIIGKSGTCTLNESVQNGLHFEIYNNGKVINPEKYYNVSLKELLKK